MVTTAGGPGPIQQRESRIGRRSSEQPPHDGRGARPGDRGPTRLRARPTGDKPDSSVFTTLGRLIYRFRWVVIAGAAALLAVAATLAIGVFGALSGSGFVDPASESARANQIAATELPRVDSDVIAIYTGSGSVTDPSYEDAINSVVAGLPSEYVDHVDSYYSTKSDQLVSADEHSTLILIRLVGGDEGERLTSYAAIKDDLANPPTGLTVLRGGTIPVSADINQQVENDIKRAELLSFPILLILLAFVMGGLVAAGLPILVGAMAIVGALALVRLLTMFTDVSAFTINIVTMLGLGLAIDYALLIVNRFREELRRLPTIQAALTRTLATAGRTVAFSSTIVTASLAALLVYPQVYFRSMALGGMAAAGVAAIGSLTLLPALLAVLGHRVDSVKVRRPRKMPGGRHRLMLPGRFFRVAQRVMRRPFLYAVGVLAGLLVLGSPFTHAAFGDIDVHSLPNGMESKAVAEQVQAQFPGGNDETVDAIVTFAPGISEADSNAGLVAYAADLGRLPGVTSATVTGQTGSTARVSVTNTADPSSAEARDLVTAVRLVPAPPGAAVLVGGSAARVMDLLTSLRDGLFWLVLILFSITFIGLFLAFGSVVLPLKAILLSLLSLLASCGVIVWIFQQGHLSGLLDFTVTGTIEPTQLVLMIVVTFALSTDYEVFMLSRVREEWDATGDNRLAVARGLQGAAPIVTSAALLLVVVIGSFSTSGIVFVKMIGIGMIVAIILDATIVRAILVPATMRLLGRANWWAPPPMRRWWEKYHRPERIGDVSPVSPGEDPVGAGHAG